MFSLNGYGILPEERNALDDLPDSIGKMSHSNRIVMIASSNGQAERLKDIFREKDYIVPVIDNNDIIRFSGAISISEGKLSSGLFLDGLMLLTEKEIFGKRPSFRPMIKSKVSNLLFSLDDIQQGDFIVHREHGIGIFSGIVRQRPDENETELISIDYSDGRLYIPVHTIKKISKYHSKEGSTPKIDRLGGRTWERKKERIRKKVHQMASRLLSLYADRRFTKGFTFSSNTELHREFDSFFEYEETPDQLDAIEEIKNDMESEKPMERLLCGDVGYGKTEVAMRAAFKAVYDNRQVAVLVPTTILAEQHFRTFKARFSGFPITIDFLSRFKSKKQLDVTHKRIAGGEIDIVIGTHILLSKKTLFSRLGLLIIDEEHRFGVGQKEKIKELSRKIDVLSLTATPIPRTLHMALSGIRQISVIETPPEERLAVKSVVVRFNDRLIKDAVLSELQRSGQVFFVHNRIEDIYRVADHIKKQVPGADVGVAHGQMSEGSLEKIMHLFFEGGINVLVSTSIIGRSNVKAYAFFLVPGKSLITEQAKKRLQAVQDMSYLGAGFRFALKDLEIRGAGNLFGPEQSGQIDEIGFDLYVQMLEKAVAELKGLEIKEEIDTIMDFRISAFIPQEYIENIALRLSFYRRIVSLRNEKDIEEFRSELQDRFGPPPAEIIRLLDVIRIRILAQALHIIRLQEIQGKVRIFFSHETVVEPHALLELQKKAAVKIHLFQEGFEIDVKGFLWEQVFQTVHGTLKELFDSVLNQ
jgi:transcription-repair coupling factor (superfamily II helicase)